MSLKNSQTFIADECRSVQITKKDQAIGPRIGGRVPLGVEPTNVREGETEYWLTIPWLHGNELSLFLWLSPDASDGNCTWTNSRKVHSSANSLVQAVVHPELPRSSHNLFRSSLASRGLKIGSPIKDINPYDPEMPWPMHKLGGKPFFEDPGAYAYELTDNLISIGYVHVLQMTFPTNLDANIKASWPFGELIFHLFASVRSDEPDFQYIWA